MVLPLLVLDDAKAHLNERLWIDPHLVTAKVHQALSENKLRRNCSLVIRSGALRSLHDIVTLYGLEQIVLIHIYYSRL